MAIKVLLLGAGGNAGMNFAKCLNMAGGYEITGADVSANNLAAVGHMYPRTELLPTDLAEKLVALKPLIDEHDFVHAQPDAEVGFLLKHVVSKKIFNHDLEHWRYFRDKIRVQRDLKQLKTSYLAQTTTSEFKDMMVDGRVWVRAIKGAGSRAALPVGTLEQAKNWMRYWCEFKGYTSRDFMLCEYLPGREYAVQLLFNKGELVHAQARERVEYFFNNVMPSGQSSTPSVACIVNDEQDVYDTAVKACGPLPHGIYGVDIKRNSDEVPVATEVNYGRFYTTSDFFAAHGVNTPHAYVQLAVNKGMWIPSIATAQPGTWYRGLDREPTSIKA